MERQLEPELMDDPYQAQVYANADFAEENQGFVDRFLPMSDHVPAGHVVDIGCGPGDIPIRMARTYSALCLTGIDASSPMIALAEQAVREAGLATRISFITKRFQDVVLSEAADAVIANSLLHHVPNPLSFWYAVKTMANPGAPVLVMDLRRPESSQDAQRLVDQYAGEEPEQLRHDFYHSLLAAFTEDEVSAQLAESNLSCLRLEVLDDRHWIVHGRLS